MMILRPDTPAQRPMVESLLDDAFGPDRRIKAAERLRAGCAPAEGLSLVALDNAEVVGTARMWHIEAGGCPALMLGPIAVKSGCRNRGVGRALVDALIRRAFLGGHCAAVAVGDASYYGRFGFRRDLTFGLELPGLVDCDRLMGLELAPGALAGASGPLRPATSGNRPDGVIRQSGPAGYRFRDQ